MFIAIGGITVQPGLARAEFSFHTLRSLAQVRRWSGLIDSRVSQQGELYFSLTAWDSPVEMKRFATSGAHARAMARVDAMGAVGVFHHYQSDRPPSWSEAITHWRDHHGDRFSADPAA